MNTNKIAIVVAYFGKLPNYFSLWLKSCAFNKTIDFYVFTDQYVANLPCNICCVSMTLNEVKKRASELLGFDATLETPYKCCDYKPLYGELFKDYLSKYDYWGHCDIDLIFGDLQYFFLKYNLYDYDKFCTLGHLSLYRNVKHVNSAYRLGIDIIDYKDVYTSNKIFIFDETSGIFQIMKREGYKIFTKRIFVDIATTYHRYRIIDVYNLDKPAVNFPIQTFSWENGKTFHIYVNDGHILKEEYMYIHFQKRPNFDFQFSIDVNQFYITNTGFYPMTSILSLDTIRKYNPYYGYLYELIEYNFNILKRRIKNYIKRRLQR